MRDEIEIVIPGDDVTSYIPLDKKCKLGIGLKRKKKKVCDSRNIKDTESIRIFATLAGRLLQNRDTWFIWTNSKRYQPQPEDRVVGIIQDRMGSFGGVDVYRVDVGSPHTCSLSSMAFEGATKRNRPQFSAGVLVYARVSSNSIVSDPTLSCMLGHRDTCIPRRDWMTEEAAYGELKGGTLQKISLGLARNLLSPDSAVLEELSKLPFEVAIGVNGYLWIHAARPEYTILIRNAIINSQSLTPEQVRAMIRSLMDTVKKNLAAEA